MAEIAGWSRDTQSEAPGLRLMMKAGGAIDLHDPEGELQRILSTLSDDFVSLDDILNASGLYHVDERLGRFGYSDGVWILTAKVDLPFQADVSIGFQLETTPKFPESMPKNVLWIQDNLGQIWNGAAHLVNALIESEGIAAPESFALHHLWASIPDAALNAAEWRFIVEIKDMYESFEVVFHGLEPVNCNVA